jgi:transcriptional regulator with XRE-family HTH domain
MPSVVYCSQVVKMTERFGGVRGDLIRWARSQQGLSMRDVQEQGGLALGFQSEIENGKKTEVRSDTLQRWLRVLNVTEPFVRGEIPQWVEDRSRVSGLAADVGLMIASGQIGPNDLSAMGAMERIRTVLKLVGSTSKTLPRPVLAWVLRMEPAILDGIIDGSLPCTPWVLEALIDLTGLPESYFKTGTIPNSIDGLHNMFPTDVLRYIPALRLAQQRGISPEELLALVRCTDLTLLDLIQRTTAH